MKLKKFETLENLDDDLLKSLKYGGFIIEDYVNELSQLREILLTSRYNSDTFSLTIAPTLDCNFRCSYCYEKDNLRNSKMNNDIFKYLLKFIENQMKNIKVLGITWYGGEPLLAFDVIENLSYEIIKMCKNYDVNYVSGMVTNGYLLTRDKVEKFKDLNISNIQITLDGTQKYHDKKRYLKDGSGTFNKIINNIEKTIDILPSTSIRINLDKNNKDDLQNFLKFLNKIDTKSKLNVYIAKVKSYNDYDKDCCLNNNEFIEEELNFCKRDGNISYPILSSSYCSADTRNAFIINYDGNIYKCWQDIGILDKSVGYLNDLGLIFNHSKRYYDYMHYDVTIDENCYKCKFLPICMGGCPNERLEYNTRDCVKYKYMLDSFIKEFVYKLQNKKEKNYEILS